MTSAGSNHMDNPVHQSEILDNSDILSPLTGTTELPVDSVTMPQSEEHSPSQPKYPDVKSIKEPSPLKPTENLEGDSGVAEVDVEVIDKLTYGLLAQFLPKLQRSQATLTEVNENQRILIETLQQENAKFAECDALVEVQDMMSKAKLYQNKLLSLRKDMMALHDKSAKLKKRALKLQQQKHKQILQQEQERERELDREQQLVAKLSTSKR